MGGLDNAVSENNVHPVSDRGSCESSDNLVNGTTPQEKREKTSDSGHTLIIHIKDPEEEANTKSSESGHKFTINIIQPEEETKVQSSESGDALVVNRTNPEGRSKALWDTNQYRSCDKDNGMLSPQRRSHFLVRCDREDTNSLDRVKFKGRGGKLYRGCDRKSRECQEKLLSIMKPECDNPGATTNGTWQRRVGGAGKEQKVQKVLYNTCSSSSSSSSEQLGPPDGGWGWMVALGSFIIALLIPSMPPCFGVLFSRYLMEAGSSSAETAWIFNTLSFMWNIGGVLCRPLTSEFGWRVVAMLASVVAALGFTISAFSPSPQFLFFSFSLLTGWGGGTITAMCFTIIPKYFERRRGAANAIMMAGVCVGQIIAPPAARMLQDEFGDRGATLILGAILLNACVGAVFFHPVEWHLKPRLVKEEKEDEEIGEKLLVEKDITLQLTRGLVHSNSFASFSESVQEDHEGELTGIIARARLSRLQAVRRMSGASYASGLNSTISISTVDVAGIGALVNQGNIWGKSSEMEQSIVGSKPCSRMWNIFCRVTKSITSDLGILRSPRACIICLGGMLCINGYLNFLMMVPFAMVSAGLSLDDSAWCISVYALCNLLMRMTVSTLSDFPWFRIRECYFTGFLIMSGTMAVFPLVSSPMWLMVTMAVLGGGIGINMGLYNIVMIDVMGLELLAPTFGAASFTVGIGFICFGPLIGLIRDTSDSYAVSMWVTSFMLLLAFILWLLMPLAVAHDAKRAATHDTNKIKTCTTP